MPTRSRHVLRTHSDSEIIVQLYEEHGEGVRDLLSPESLARTGYFDADAVARDRALVAEGAGEKLGRFASLGLGGVVATQL
jgi:hypothetical protein